MPLDRESGTLVLSLSRVRLFVTPWTVARQTPLSMGILQARILEWVAMPSSRGSSRPKDSNWGLLHCRRILYQLSYQGNPGSLWQYGRLAAGALVAPTLGHLAQPGFLGKGTLSLPAERMP